MPRELESALLFCVTSTHPQKHRDLVLDRLRTRYQRPQFVPKNVLDLSAHALVGYTPLNIWAAFHKRQPYALRIAPSLVFRVLADFLDGELTYGLFAQCCLACRAANDILACTTDIPPTVPGEL